MLRIPPTGCLSRCMQIPQADDPGERTGRRGLPGGRDRTSPRGFAGQPAAATAVVAGVAAPPIRSASMTIPSRSRLRVPEGQRLDHRHRAARQPVDRGRARRCSSGRSCASCSTASRLRSRSFTTTAVRTRTRISRRDKPRMAASSRTSTAELKNPGATTTRSCSPGLLINVNNYWVLNPVHYGSSQSAGYPGSSTSVLANRLANAPMYFPATRVVELSDKRDDADDPAEGRHRRHRGLCESARARTASSSCSPGMPSRSKRKPT